MSDIDDYDGSEIGSSIDDFENIINTNEDLAELELKEINIEDPDKEEDIENPDALELDILDEYDLENLDEKDEQEDDEYITHDNDIIEVNEKNIMKDDVDDDPELADPNIVDYQNQTNIDIENILKYKKKDLEKITLLSFIALISFEYEHLTIGAKPLITITNETNPYEVIKTSIIEDKFSLSIEKDDIIIPLKYNRAIQYFFDTYENLTNL